jgi:endo-1,4-beta-xylanase
MLSSRRSLLAGAAAMIGGAATYGTARAAATERLPGLNALAAQKGLFFGSAVDDPHLHDDPALLERLQLDCGMLVSEYSFKWDSLQPEPGQFDFAPADALMDFAAKNDMRVRGHTLIWHEGNPVWLDSALTPQDALSLLNGYISTVCGHFRGKLAHWDVVNEPLSPEDGQPFGLRATPWLRALGPGYIDLAFRAGAKADPTALRMINEYGLDYAIDWQETRRTALLKLLEALLTRGVPIQGVGLQAHLDAAEKRLDQRVLSRFVADIAAMGLKIVVTELDVRDDGLPADIGVRDRAVADHARAWLDAVLPNPAVLGLLTWGLSDRRSWLNDKFPRKDHLAQRPLPLDAELRPTALWYAIAGALDSVPGR